MSIKLEFCCLFQTKSLWEIKDVNKILQALVCTFVTGFQLDLSPVAAVAPVGSSPDPEHVGGPWLEAVHCHHVGACFQDSVVLLALVL